MSDSLLTLKAAIERLSTRETLANPNEARRAFLDFRAALTRGEVRAADKVDGHWVVNAWVKQGILFGFRLGELQEMSDGDVLSFVDKSTRILSLLAVSLSPIVFVSCPADLPSAKEPTLRPRSSACLPCSSTSALTWMKAR